MASKQHKLFWGSSYDRGLDMLLYMWPDIRKEFPDAELHICYGWKLFDMLARTNPERRQWKASMEIMMKHPGVIHHGRVGKDELREIRKSCGIWAYPTYFTEINCITALDCMRDGVVPVTMDLAALDEIVGAGVKVHGNIKDPGVMKTYLKELLSMMKDEKRWKKESIKAQRFTNRFDWSVIAREWDKQFETPISNPKVTVITPTIRDGWWNLMSHNLSTQTYKDFEWLIVDDHPENRRKTADKYAKLYGLNINYLRGDKHNGYKRKCALVRANNIGWQNATGELLVFLQDFILIPPDGIERLVDIYRHHPGDLIAPVDIYYKSIPTDKDNKEDWWNGNISIITEKDWTNVRVQYNGMRYTDNPFDFEMDYGAIPKKVIEELNGWWEWFDDGIGYDNTEIAYRALLNGHKVVVDDTNIAKCINIWPTVGGTEQNIVDRERILNTPRYKWFIRQMSSGKLPVVRDIKIDGSIHLGFQVPQGVEDEQSNKWITAHAEEIAESWGDTDAESNRRRTKTTSKAKRS